MNIENQKIRFGVEKRIVGEKGILGKGKKREKGGGGWYRKMSKRIEISSFFSLLTRFPRS